MATDYSYLPIWLTKIWKYLREKHQDTWKLFDICAKCTEMGVIWLFFPPGFVYMQIMKKVASQQGLSF